MKPKKVTGIVIFGAMLGILAGIAFAAQDRSTLKVPGGLAFSEFKGYEKWPVISISENGGVMAAILGNPIIITAFRSGIPGNGNAFPDGSKMAKIHWMPKRNETDPGHPLQPGTLLNIDLMVKDSKRFADSGGWGWAVFDYEPATNSFTPGTQADKPPQGHDAKCGFSCHTEAKSRDYVFTAYGNRG
jgi:hypothetical protein